MKNVFNGDAKQNGITISLNSLLDIGYGCFLSGIGLGGLMAGTLISSPIITIVIASTSVYLSSKIIANKCVREKIMPDISADNKNLEESNSKIHVVITQPKKSYVQEQATMLTAYQNHRSEDEKRRGIEGGNESIIRAVANPKGDSRCQIK